MSTKPTAEMVGRRAELMAELFLQDLGAEFVARPSAAVGYDFFVGFNNPEGGVNLAAVEVKATDQPVPARFMVQRRLFRRLVNSNIPVLLLVVNVKDNRLFYALPASDPPEDSDANTVSIPLTPVDEAAKDELRHLLASPHAAVSGLPH